MTLLLRLPWIPYSCHDAILDEMRFSSDLILDENRKLLAKLATEHCRAVSGHLSLRERLPAEIIPQMSCLPPCQMSSRTPQGLGFLNTFART
jgi:hypothetical protein